MKNEVKIPTKPEILSKIIYKAIVRYVKAKKSPNTARNLKFDLDFNRVWRGNIQALVDPLEKNK